jgi:exonuclease I
LEIEASSDTSDNFVQAMQVLVQDEVLSKLIYRAEQSYEDLDDFERWKVSKYLDGYMSMSQQDYLTYIETTENEYETTMADDWRENMKLQMYLDYWSNSELRFKPKFREFINGILAELHDR